MSLTETINTGNILGHDKSFEVITLVENIEKIVKYAKILGKREVLSERTLFRIELLEGEDSGMIDDIVEDTVTPDLTSIDEPIIGDETHTLDTVSNPVVEPTLDAPISQDPLSAASDAFSSLYPHKWLGNDVNVKIDDVDGMQRYTVGGANGPLITYNEETRQHDGVENYTEEQLAELDNIITELNTIKLEELEDKNFGEGKYPGKAAPKIVKAKLEATGKAPTGKVPQYLETKKDPKKDPSEQYSQEEAKIPFTQACADLKESTRFNGYRLGDSVKVPGYKNCFTLSKIIIGEEPKFVLTEGKVTITVNPIVDTIELENDRDLKFQRTNYIMEDTRAIWEEMEKEMLNEGCAGGVCTLAGPMHPTNTTLGIGSVVSVGSMFTKTPIHTFKTETNPNDVYAYIKNNNLHVSPYQASLSHLMSNFGDSNLDIQKIYDDAVSSIQLNEVDSSYEYKSVGDTAVEVDELLNEGYDQLKKLGIV
jgi:hypothetical protein